MSIETVIIALVVFGATALVMVASFVLAKCEDEARRMADDKQQHHYGS